MKKQPDESIPDDLFWDLSFLVALHGEIGQNMANAAPLAGLHADEALKVRKIHRKGIE